MKPLILASGSPVRRRLLAMAGLHFEVVPARVDEVLPGDAPAEEAAAALCLCKAHEVRSRRGDAVVVGADQVLVLPDGTLAGKTHTRDEARARVRELAGRQHVLISAAAVVSSDVEEVVVDRVELRFRALSDEQIETYLGWGEWRGTAGSYLYESRGIHLVEDVRGDVFTILGLPLVPLLGVLRSLGATPL